MSVGAGGSGERALAEHSPTCLRELVVAVVFLDQARGDETRHRPANTARQHSAEVGARADGVGELGQRPTRSTAQNSKELLLEFRDGLGHPGPKPTIGR